MPALGRRAGPPAARPSYRRRRSRGQHREEEARAGATKGGGGARARGSDANQSQPTEQRGRDSDLWGRNESSVGAGGRPIFTSERVARGARTGDWWRRAAPRAGEQEKCRLVVWLRAPCAHVAPARLPWP
jgi:hypothetical protein